ncbi:hypothetical protein IR010_08655 [Flavobacterium sp. MR2016-29]|uniref:hypothetical protein n=1 Tax=Flavobacterium sp. MR2016-29 TaxID=2783795 RepID=UPI00188B018A|nr:hypothetical protein [Flavobacterium sp. MR2016-29]MBF4492611.1 hypothetical protein [Flavobacterium sp. MR2016-29]
MKTIITFVKKIICNLLLVLTSIQVTYSLVNHFFYSKPYPDFTIIIICLLVATYASVKREKYSKL